MPRSAARGFFRGALLWLGAVLSVVVHVPGRARAEILILKDGSQMPCRVLAQDRWQVTVRDAGGNRLTLKKKDIARIEPTVSSVEVYEAVAELVPADGGLPGYYLGVWCLENGTKSAARRMFEMAARDPELAGRACFALAGLAESPRERRRHLIGAVTADPTLAEAVEALLAEGDPGGEIPQEMLSKVIRALAGIRLGRLGEAAEVLRELEGDPDKEAVETLAARLFRMTGFTLGSLRARCSGAAGGVETAGGQSPSGLCDECGGTGHVRCKYCRGKGHVPCSSCKGQGVTRTRRRLSSGGYRTVTTVCGVCKGAGIRECPLCVRRPKGPWSVTRTVSEFVSCSRCKGTGRVRRVTSRTLLGSVTVTYATCTVCGGRGGFERARRLKVNISASGLRRCRTCNKDGHISPPERGAGPAAAAPAPTRPDAAQIIQSVADPTQVFTAEELPRLEQFARMLESVTAGKADYRWRAGEKVPLYPPAPRLEGGKEDLVFACGKWVTPARKEILLRRAKALGDKPREVDLSAFKEWMQNRELSFLRGAGVPIGAGRDPRGEVLGLAAIYERARKAGRMDPLDRAQMFRTLFRPAAAVGGAGSGSSWSASGGPAGQELSLVLHRSPNDWPALEVTARPAPGTGLDVGKLASALVEIGGLRDNLTLYYRVKGCRRSVEGEADSPKVRLTLEIAVCAAALGVETHPKRAWLAQIGKPAGGE